MTQAEAFGLTIAVESLVAALLCAAFGRPWLRGPAAATLGTACTHPVVWHVFLALRATLGPLLVYGLEAFAVLVESFFYRGIAGLTMGRALGVSALANLCSWGVCELIYALLPAAA